MYKVYTNLEKEFKSEYGPMTITRAEYEGATVPMVAVLMSDEQMQKIVDAINLSMCSDYDAEHLDWLKRYRGDGKGLTREQINFADKMSEREFEYWESCAREFGMEYYEDLESWEYEEIRAAVEAAESESGQ